MNRSIGARWMLGLLLLLATGAAPSTAGEKTRLRLDLREGDTHRFAMSLDQQMAIELGAMGNQKTQNTMNLDYTFKVMGVADDGTLTLESSYDRIGVVVRAMGNEITYDTADETPPAGENPLSLLDQLVGQKVTYRVSPQGRVLEVRGFEELLAKMKAEASEDPGSMNLVGLVEAGFGERALKTMCQQGLVIYSEEPVGPGDAWSTDLELSNPAMGAVDAKATYDVRGVATHRDRQCVELGMSMTMKFDGDSPLLQQMRDSFARQGTDAKLDWELGEVKSSGTVWVERTTGLAVDSESGQTMHATFTLTLGTGAEAVTFDMQMDLDQKIRVELLD